jgi:phosphatidylethanolamine-binding protein (PEBP) family uncharacterized protein
VAALLVSGCGGGGSGEETASTAAQAKGQSTSPEEATSKAKGAAQGAASQGSHRQRQSAGSPTQSSSAQGSGKHGKSITLPEGEPEPQATPAEQANATVADIALSSPDVGQGEAIPAEFTCAGKGSWPALRWQGVPADSKELVLFAMNAQPVQGKLFFDWALAGIDPALGGIEAGKLPKGAVVGQNSFGEAGYELCPTPGQAETYVFALYALPKALSPAKGFDPAALRQQAQAISRNAGLLAASYGRG